VKRLRFHRDCLAISAALVASAALAAEPIGSATRVVPSVTGTMGGRTAAVAAGDSVVQDETMQTGPTGDARLRFVDETDLAIGPGSTVKLDRFVFAGGGSAASVVLSATRGAFRFATGVSAHEAYRIITPAAVIGVRGTRFSFAIRNGRLNLDVEQGVVIVCPRGKGAGDCVEARPGESVQARAGAPAQVFAAGGPPGAPPARGAPPPGNPLGALPAIGLGIGVPLLLGDGPFGGGRRGGYDGGRRGPVPCLNRLCR
jgi:hypothetical protein